MSIDAFIDREFQREIDFLCDELFESAYNAKTRPAYIRGSLSASEIAEVVFSAG